MRNGQGIEFLNGSKYVGAWSAGLKDGYGTLEYHVDGVAMKFGGYFEAGKRHGVGTEQTSAGIKVFKGQWEGGEREG